MTETVAIAACIILFGLAIFQFLLALGFPIGRFAWRGTHNVLPPKLRVASLFSVLLYILFSVVILSQAGVLEVFNTGRLIDTSMWILTVYFFLGIFMNGISRSKPERRVMTPLAAVLALLFLYVALQP